MTKRSNNFPKARTADLITERVGGELVVYDGQTSEAHCLSAIAAAVFTAADGNTSPADLAALASAELNERVDVDHVERALAELEDRGLVVSPEPSGLSRRGFMQRSAAVGGVVVAGSLVTSVVTPAYGGTGSTGGTFGAWSSMAVLFEYNGKYYGAHWSAGSPPNGAGPTNWGATEANANCKLTIPTGVTVQSGAIGGVTATTGTNTITITVPAGVTISSVATWFGQGGPGCHGCQHPAVSGSAPTYVLTFSC